MKTKACIMVILLLSLGMMAIGADVKQELLGQWRSVEAKRGDNNTWDFLEEGTLLVSGGMTPVNGKFVVYSDGRIKLEMQVPFFGTQISLVKAEFKGNRVILRDPKGHPMVLERVR